MRGVDTLADAAGALNVICDDGHLTFETRPGVPTTRRKFLQSLAAVSTLGAAAIRYAAADLSPPPQTSQPVTEHQQPRQRAAERGNRTDSASTVALLADPRIVRDRVVQRGLLRSNLIDGLMAYAGTRTYEAALHEIFRPDDVILMKFNRSEAARIGTTDAMTTVLVQLFMDAGYSPEQLLVLEGGTEPEPVARTSRPDLRWQGKQVRFGRSGADSFIAALDQATAILNVPFLKSHHLATMTGCLKNLSHGLIRHPARFHANGCDPAIAEIVATPEIRNKLKLNVVNGLRSVFDRGPEASESEIAAGGHLIIGKDPVACDAVGYTILNQMRQKYALAPLLSVQQIPRQLITAAELGLGHYEDSQISLQSVAG